MFLHLSDFDKNSKGEHIIALDVLILLMEMLHTVVIVKVHGKVSNSFFPSLLSYQHFTNAPELYTGPSSVSKNLNNDKNEKFFPHRVHQN